MIFSAGIRPQCRTSHVTSRRDVLSGERGGSWNSYGFSGASDPPRRVFTGRRRQWAEPVTCHTAAWESWESNQTIQTSDSSPEGFFFLVCKNLREKMLSIEKGRRFLIGGLLTGDEKHSIALHHSEQTPEADRPRRLSLHASDAHTNLHPPAPPTHTHREGSAS